MEEEQFHMELQALHLVEQNDLRKNEVNKSIDCPKDVNKCKCINSTFNCQE